MIRHLLLPALVLGAVPGAHADSDAWSTLYRGREHSVSAAHGVAETRSGYLVAAHMWIADAGSRAGILSLDRRGVVKWARFYDSVSESSLEPAAAGGAVLLGYKFEADGRSITVLRIDANVLAGA